MPPPFHGAAALPAVGGEGFALRALRVWRWLAASAFGIGKEKTRDDFSGPSFPDGLGPWPPRKAGSVPPERVASSAGLSMESPDLLLGAHPPSLIGEERLQGDLLADFPLRWWTRRGRRVAKNSPSSS